MASTVFPATGSGVLIYDGIDGVAPQRVRVVHHQCDDHGNEFAQQTSAITQLVAVDLATPRRTTVDQLIAQRVEAIEHDREQRGRIAAGECGLRRLLRAGEPIPPLLFTDPATLELPKQMKNVGVVEQRADAAGELLPDQVVNALAGVEIAEFLEKSCERDLVGRAVTVVKFLRVSSIEGDPQKDEFAVHILRLLGAMQPAQGPVDAQR